MLAKVITLRVNSFHSDHSEYYMGAHVLLNLLNKLGKRDKM